MTTTIRGVSVEGRTGSLDLKGNRSYTVTYRVQADDKNDGASTVLLTPGLPIRGQPFSVGNSFDFGAFANKLTARQAAGSPTEWEVDVEYTSELDKQPDEEEEENPLLRPSELSISFVTERVIIPGRFNDPAVPNIGGQLELGIVNSAGELFDPQPEMEVSRPVLTITKNLPVPLDLKFHMELADAVNRDAFLGAEPRQLRMLAPQCQRQYENGVLFWRVTYQMAFKFEKWDIQLLNHGNYYLTGGVVTDFDETSKGYRRKGLLAADGDVLAANANPTFTTLRVYREMDFSAIGIDRLLR